MPGEAREPLVVQQLQPVHGKVRMGAELDRGPPAPALAGVELDAEEAYDDIAHRSILARMTRALFICGKARRRSPTAADIAVSWGVEADFGGLSADADERLSVEQIDWAEVIFVMERRQKARLARQFTLGSKRVVCLNIPDRYAYMEPALVARLKPAIARALGIYPQR